MTPTRSKHFILPIAAALVYPFPTVLQAYEGMWLPTLLQAVEGHMRTEGLVISAEDIYSINNGSLISYNNLSGAPL